jgi:hypothetical protein
MTNRPRLHKQKTISLSRCLIKYKTSIIMEQPIEMNTLSQILEKLRLKGLDNEIKMTDHGKMQGVGVNKIYNPEDLTIIKTYRFEGASDPGDNSVLYLLEDKDGQIGYILDAYGMYSSQEGAGFDDFLKKIPTADRDLQELFT